MTANSVAVIVASLGRPAEIADLIEGLRTQTHQPDQIVLSVTSDADLPPAHDGMTVVMGSKGLCAQRNRGLDAISGEPDIIAFFDDDYLPSRFTLAGIAHAFSKWPDVVGLNGELLADGVKHGGVSLEDAQALISAHDEKGPPDPASFEIQTDLSGLYGCNMVYRRAAIGETRFDENLPLYGWQEDIDFAAQLLPRGRLVKTNAFFGVHRGVKGARQSGLRLGYSQIANPLYLARKGTMARSYALRLAAKNMLANHARVLRPEPWIDRAGRASGNWRALFDALRGRADPRRILQL